jgi:hypothetical protein
MTLHSRSLRSISAVSLSLALSALLSFFSPVAAHAEGSPGRSGTAHAKYLGVASCSSSNCHGSVAPRNASNVLQNEYSTWTKHDAHAKSWLSLTSADSKKIGEHLGIENPEQEPLCLKCHATYVKDQALQDDKFRIEDGVGCESCHGAAEHYISTHTEQGATHEANLKNGMADLVSPSTRASFCLSCHLGSDDKTVDHRLIGAGHPRLTFELDTFSAIQPAHWDVDDDYRSRKEAYVPARAWLIGQLSRSQELISAMVSEKRSRAGEGLMAGPELTLLYCYSCHHSLTEEQWKTRSYDGKPGELRLNISSLIVAEQALLALDSAFGQRFGEQVLRLHDGKETAAAAAALSTLLSDASKKYASASYDQATSKKLLKKLTEYGASAQHPPFEVAEQLAMGISGLAASLSTDGSLHKREVDQIYSALATPAAFQPELFTTACGNLLKAL